jgi:hypothetical protein
MPTVDVGVEEVTTTATKRMLGMTSTSPTSRKGTIPVEVVMVAVGGDEGKDEVVVEVGVDVEM